MLVDVLAAVALVAWLAVLLLPSAPWRTREQLTPRKLGSDPISPEMGSDPNFIPDVDLAAVTVLIPARNEATAIAATLAGLTRQGRNVRVLVIDDQSSDGTGEAAIEANAGFAPPLDLTVIDGEALPSGWGGKLWALNQGLQQVDRDYCLLLDAEIVLASGVLSTLLQKARAESRAMTSVMAKLRCETFWEKLLVPPFIFFFKLLYPFAAVNDPARKTAAAAGGCILIRTDVLNAIGGFAAIRDALIDDCTLAARVKAAGHSVWLGLSEHVMSSRSYPNLVDFRRMVARTAFTQLRYSVVLLVIVVDVMVIVFVVPVLALGFSTEGWGLASGIGALAAMAAAFWPTVRFYSLTPLWVLTLPIAAVFFLAMTVESAVQYWRGVTARWKDRTYPSQR
jgi:hopene-associated glycosyltransferase HpnB